MLLGERRSLSLLWKHWFGSLHISGIFILLKLGRWMHILFLYSVFVVVLHIIMQQGPWIGRGGCGWDWSVSFCWFCSINWSPRCPGILLPSSAQLVCVPSGSAGDICRFISVSQDLYHTYYIPLNFWEMQLWLLLTDNHLAVIGITCCVLAVFRGCHYILSLQTDAAKVHNTDVGPVA